MDFDFFLEKNLLNWFIWLNIYTGLSNISEKSLHLVFLI